jgi:hypothetical protein
MVGDRDLVHVVRQISYNPIHAPERNRGGVDLRRTLLLDHRNPGA